MEIAMRTRLAVLLIAISAAAASAQPYLCGVPMQTRPSHVERAMLVMTNAYRMAPIACRDELLPGAGPILEAYPAVAPLAWADGLGASARFHSIDMAGHDCLQHNDCDGSRTWAERIGSFWPGWRLIGENIAAGYTDPVTVVGGLIADPHDGAPAADHDGYDGHRWNIMYDGYTHLGCGFAENAAATYARYYTQDFGRPLDPSAGEECARSPIVAGSHVMLAGEAWLLANVYDAGGAAPAAVIAVVDGEASAMELRWGAPAAGTYRLVLAGVGAGCHGYHFAADAAGMRWRYPAAGELALGCAIDDAEAGDFNLDGVRSVGDIFDFLNAWLAGERRADADEDGVLTTADIGAFLTAWFGG
jgi:hypothetical protein